MRGIWVGGEEMGNGMEKGAFKLFIFHKPPWFGLGCNTLTLVSKNTKATLKCYVLHCYVGTVFTHKPLA